MRLMSLSRFRERYFEDGSAPSMATLRRWVDRGDLHGGRKVGSSYYVDIHIWEASDDNLVAKVLAET